MESDVARGSAIPLSQISFRELHCESCNDIVGVIYGEAKIPDNILCQYCADNWGMVLKYMFHMPAISEHVNRMRKFYYENMTTGSSRRVDTACYGFRDRNLVINGEELWPNKRCY